MNVASERNISTINTYQESKIESIIDMENQINQASKGPFHPGNQPDEYVRCPYFPEHELRRSRLPYHLVKCQSNPRAPKLLACPFNYMHRVRPEDCQEHLLLCEDRVIKKYADRERPSYARTEKQCNRPQTDMSRDNLGSVEEEEEF